MDTGYVIVGVVAVVVGLSFAAFAWVAIQPYQEDRQQAEAVSATVVSSEVVEVRNSEGQIQYSPEVTYRYTYGGSDYQSSALYPNNGSMVGSRSRAREVTDRYPQGRTLTAYVNADTPTTAFLIDESAPLWYWAAPVLGALLILYGLYSVVQGLRGAEASSATL